MFLYVVEVIWLCLWSIVILILSSNTEKFDLACRLDKIGVNLQLHIDYFFEIDLTWDCIELAR